MSECYFKSTYCAIFFHTEKQKYLRVLTLATKAKSQYYEYKIIAFIVKIKIDVAYISKRQNTKKTAHNLEISVQ